MSTNFANSGIENAIVIDEDELSPENTAARPRKRRRTGERDGKAETALEDCDAVAAAEVRTLRPPSSLQTLIIDSRTPYFHLSDSPQTVP
jgi:hypothetical protein